jgi:hypothetical protein
MSQILSVKDVPEFKFGVATACMATSVDQHYVTIISGVSLY